MASWGGGIYRLVPADLSRDSRALIAFAPVPPPRQRVEKGLATRRLAGQQLGQPQVVQPPRVSRRCRASTSCPPPPPNCCPSQACRVSAFLFFFLEFYLLLDWLRPHTPPPLRGLSPLRLNPTHRQSSAIIYTAPSFASPPPRVVAATPHHNPPREPSPRPPLYP